MAECRPVNHRKMPLHQNAKGGLGIVDGVFPEQFPITLERRVSPADIVWQNQWTIGERGFCRVARVDIL